MGTVSGTLRPTPLPWLPVLSHITPPRLRRMTATNQLLSKIWSSTVTLPLISEIEFHPEVRLASRRPVWLEKSQQEEVSPQQRSTEKWAVSDVINNSLIVDPSIAPARFDLRQSHFRTGQGRSSSAGIRLQIHFVPGADLRRLCHTLSAIVQIWYFPAGCQPYI